MKLKIELKTIGGSVLFSFEKEGNTIKDTLVQAVKERADLQGAYLQGAYLQGAYLRGADLRGAYLRGADLQGAYLQGAYLRGADLQGAYLQGADLQGAYLRGADLRGADEKTLPQDYINQCSRDMLFIFEHLKHELPYLRNKLVQGKVNGSQYEGECACLIGSLGKGNKECVDKVAKAIPYYEMGLQNMGEQWFLNIKEGDTEKDSFFVRHALKLIDSVLGEYLGVKA